MIFRRRTTELAKNYFFFLVAPFRKYINIDSTQLPCQFCSVKSGKRRTIQQILPRLKQQRQFGYIERLDQNYDKLFIIIIMNDYYNEQTA